MYKNYVEVYILVSEIAVSKDRKGKIARIVIARCLYNYGLTEDVIARYLHRTQPAISQYLQPDYKIDSTQIYKLFAKSFADEIDSVVKGIIE